MDRRRWLLPVAAVAIYAAGVATGWSFDRVSGGLDPEDVAASRAGSVEAAADASVARVDGAVAAGAATTGAPSAEGATGGGGAGSVATVGAEGSSGSSGAAGAPGEGSSGSGPAGAAMDGGRPPGLSRETIQTEVREHRDELGFCFAWQLHQHPELAGRITMELVIGPDGHVLRAEVADDELGDETVLRCFVGVTERMEFPAPTDGQEVTVRYPFVLSPDAEEGSD